MSFLAVLANEQLVLAHSECPQPQLPQKHTRTSPSQPNHTKSLSSFPLHHTTYRPSTTTTPCRYRSGSRHIREKPSLSLSPAPNHTERRDLSAPGAYTRTTSLSFFSLLSTYHLLLCVASARRPSLATTPTIVIEQRTNNPLPAGTDLFYNPSHFITPRRRHHVWAAKLRRLRRVRL